ncbi:hypothetical protein PHYPSEUDO_008542 [Phytophthora pseudosyringae]|uniref:Ankyrin repeat protein n=1 Tax=Phytophthora pseudosyringae TaxID=221518 RepID=A0A8T1VH50_9STRA|nr:hypothetical protein PHYPSEUDO_008542 [Phytophthora pseudosyringae]
MSSAIDGAHAEVVVHLLSGDDLAYDMGEVFEEIIARGQDSLAKKIYGMYPDISDGGDLFVQMASEDRIDAVKYLLNRGCKEVGLIEEAFNKAAICRCKNVLEFLMSTGRVSVAAFDRALECAASSGSIKAVVNLYKMRCASSRGIESAFEQAGSVAVVRFLHENEQVPSMSIIACFKHACGREFAVSMPKKEWDGIVVFLYNLHCIPSEVLSEVFSNTPFDMMGLVKGYTGTKLYRQILSTKHSRTQRNEVMSTH